MKLGLSEPKMKYTHRSSVIQYYAAVKHKRRRGVIFDINKGMGIETKQRKTKQPWLVISELNYIILGEY